jgi:hypothetical protein
MEGRDIHGPSFRIPKRTVVEEAIRSIMDEAFTIRSQTLFHRLVKMRLKDMIEGKFRLSARRIRHIAANMEDVDLIIHCRDGNERAAPTICPVCGTRMNDIKNSTLYGWTVQTGRACPVCSYWTGKKRRIPTRYVFTVEKENYIGEKMEVE